MAKRKIRAAGGGRKPQGEFSQLTSPFSLRMPEDLRKQLESAATKNKRSASQELLARLNSSLLLERDKERDPALQGLLFFIARLAESLCLVYLPDNLGRPGTQDKEHMIGKEMRAEQQTKWRTDLLSFRAFKFAVTKLLNALEEPPDSGRIKRMLEHAKKHPPLSPEAKNFYEVQKSPEARGTYEFERLWNRAVEASEYNNEEIRKRVRAIPDTYLRDLLENEFLKLPKARKALELKPTKSKSK